MCLFLFYFRFCLMSIFFNFCITLDIIHAKMLLVIDYIFFSFS